MNSSKVLSLATFISMSLIGGAAYASHELENQPFMSEQDNDGHISWHEFRHELGAYPAINATIDRNGVIYLSGHVDSSFDSLLIERLAMKVRGAKALRISVDTD